MMGTLRSVVARLVGFLRRDAVIRDIEEEMRTHVEMEALENERRGMKSTEARTAAGRSFGNMGRLRELALDVRGGGFLDTLWHDISYSARLLARSPGFTSVIALTLGLGIGSTTAIFSIADAVLLRPLPFKEPGRLVMLWETIPKRPDATTYVNTSNYLHYKEHAQSLESIAGVAPASISLTGLGEPQRIQAARVTVNFFGTLGVAPVLGRDFIAEEAEEGNRQVAIVTHGFWQRSLGGTPEAVGKAIVLDDQRFILRGVLPAGFRIPTVQADVWTPMTLSGGSTMQVVGRLKTGFAFGQAAAEIKELRAALQRANSSWTERETVLVPLQEQGVNDARLTILILLGAVLMLLLIACANGAHLLLARSTRRGRELALRVAVGSSTFRLIRQLLAESFLLSLLGTVVGLLLAVICIQAFIAYGPVDVPRLQEARIDARVLLFTLGTTLMTSVLCGVVPAWMLPRLDLNAALKLGGQKMTGDRRHGLIRCLIVVAEVGLTIVLMAGAGLLIKSYVQMNSVDSGVSADRVMAIRLTLRGRYLSRQPQGEGIRSQFLSDLLTRAQAIPGVDAAAIATNLPLSGSRQFMFVQDGISPPNTEGAGFFAESHMVSSDYFRTLGISLRTGRLLAREDTGVSPAVVVISERLAGLRFPNSEALGQKLTINGVGERLVVGIVGDTKHRGLEEETAPEFYVPYSQKPPIDAELLVRADLDPLHLIPVLKREVWALDPALPIERIASLESLMSALSVQRRFNTWLFAVFSVAALILACVGIYGVVHYTVVQRTPEIGIRRALGQQSSDVLRSVLGYGLKLAVAGLVIGMIGAYWLIRVLSHLLFNVEVHDTLTFVAVTIIFLGTALVACLIPALNATKVDPIALLRSE
jgi:predicted permease